MIDSGPLTVEEIIIALWELDEEAQAKEIKDRVTENRGGGIPSQYSHSPENSAEVDRDNGGKR